MGHHISAIITLQSVDRDVADTLGLPVFVEGEATIVGLDAGHSDAWSERLGIPHASYSHMIHDSAMTLEFARRLKITEFALIETDCLGGAGCQTAALYVRERCYRPTGAKPINQTLAKLGIIRVGDRDEFESIGLNKYRSFDEFFEKTFDLSVFKDGELFSGTLRADGAGRSFEFWSKGLPSWSCDAEDYWDAFTQLREFLEGIDAMALCQGARRNAVVSGMARSMSGGRKAYLVEMSKPADSTLADIFDPAEPNEVVTLAEQHRFKSEWMASLQGGG